VKPIMVYPQYCRKHAKQQAECNKRAKEKNKQDGI
jgi:hypothetical protein